MSRQKYGSAHRGRARPITDGEEGARSVNGKNENRFDRYLLVVAPPETASTMARALCNSDRREQTSVTRLDSVSRSTTATHSESSSGTQDSLLQHGLHLLGKLDEERLSSLGALLLVLKGHALV
jgi:hypothetical protein